MVSVIIPIYNVCQFIEKGLKYIFAQDFCDYEVILIDDGSTDGSAELCDEWAKKDSRIRVFHKKNEGAGSARNVGLEQALGEYIYFFDIDDRVPEVLLSTLVRQMKETNADMMVFGYNSFDVKYKSITKVSFQREMIESNEELRGVFVDNCILKVNGFPWNKMYRKSFLDRHGLRFENQRIQQDEVFNLKCYHRVERLLFSDSVLYDYFVYDHGNTRSRFIPDRFDIYKSVYRHFCDLRDYWNLKDVLLDAYLYKRLFESLNALLRYNLVHPKCTWSKGEKMIELNRVMTDKDFLRAIDFMQKKGIDFENRLFLYAYRKRCIMLIIAMNYMFAKLRNIKNMMKQCCSCVVI